MYQTGLIFYNSLIINVSSESGRGIVSGIGVGAGYIGLIAAFLIMRPIVDAQGNQSAFLPTAGLFILFALPLLLIVRDPGERGRVDKTLFQSSYKQLYQTFKRAREHSNLFRFLIGRFMYMEAINTVVSFYVLYLINVGDFTQNEAQTMIIGGRHHRNLRIVGHRIPSLPIRTETRPHRRTDRLGRPRNRRGSRRHHVGVLGRRHHNGLSSGLPPRSPTV